jgi:predicted PurR-regulated permease PerM
MSPSKKSKHTSFLILLGLLIVVGLYTLFPFLKIVILGCVLVILFYPLHHLFLKWTGNRATISAFLSVVAVCIFLFVPLAVLLTLITSQLAFLINFSFPKEITDGWPSFLEGYRGIISNWIERFESFFHVHLNIAEILQEGAVRFAKIIAQYSPDVLSGTLDFFLGFFILLIVLFFLFRDGKIFFKKLMILSPVEDSYELRLAGEIKKTIDGVFFGSFFTGLVQAILATVGYYFAGIDGFFVWGGITFFMSFLPLVGTGAVLIPLILYLILNGEWPHALFLAIYGAVVIGSVDNLLRPLLIRTSMHPLVLFLSVFGGLAVFGAIGILLGPIILALLTATLRIYELDFTS